MLNFIQLSMNKGKGKVQQITDNNNLSKKQLLQLSQNPIPIKFIKTIILLNLFTRTLKQYHKN